MTYYGPLECKLHNVPINEESSCDECANQIEEWYDKYGDMEVVTRADVVATLFGIVAFINGRMMDYNGVGFRQRKAYQDARRHLEYYADIVLDDAVVLTPKTVTADLLTTNRMVLAALQSAGLHEQKRAAIRAEFNRLLDDLAKMDQDLIIPFPVPAIARNSQEMIAEVERRIHNHYVSKSKAIPF